MQSFRSYIRQLPKVGPMQKLINFLPRGTAGVLKLVDKLDLGSSASCVWVRLPSPAQKFSKTIPPFASLSDGSFLPSIGLLKEKPQPLFAPAEIPIRRLAASQPLTNPVHYREGMHLSTPHMLFLTSARQEVSALQISPTYINFSSPLRCEQENRDHGCYLMDISI